MRRMEESDYEDVDDEYDDNDDNGVLGVTESANVSESEIRQSTCDNDNRRKELKKLKRGKRCESMHMTNDDNCFLYASECVARKMDRCDVDVLTL